MPYRIEFTERAATQRDALPEARHKLLERGLQKLAEDPFTPVSQAVGGEDNRLVSLAPGMTVHYLVHRAVLVLVSVRILGRSLVTDA
ncbi:type II toxin-antitoxin system RelE family toxin [Streptomyces sp. enrichment culture]|uniref:type II toxin-antitoxin system RelE family toxin n=1 Tax=Streptomyces sp. enrichment culture TaxID=1795815 RepID=UPI003F54A111